MPKTDVSLVPPQGAYVAKRCPVRAQNDALYPSTAQPVAPFLQRLFDVGRAFDDHIISELAKGHADAVIITATGSQAEEATLAAMGASAPIILHGALPVDRHGRRMGRPDILVAAATGGYRTIDIKSHSVLQPGSPRDDWYPEVISDLHAPWLEDSFDTGHFIPRKRKDVDLLQIAHYQRMLEALGMAADDGRWGGIIGSESQVVWFDLDLPAWKTPSVTEGTKLRSASERYQFEFGFRLDIIATAMRHALDPSIALLVLPVQTPECVHCPWRETCRVELEAGYGDVSLLPAIGYAEWREHRDRGVTNRLELAQLDARTAELVGLGFNLVSTLAELSEFPDDTPLDLAGPYATKPARLGALEAYGIRTAGDIRALDPQTASYSSLSMGSLPKQIDLARAALAPGPAYRVRHLSEITVPRADIELDVDMENVEAGVYLWGCVVTDRSGRGLARSGYYSFVTWDPLTGETESANTSAFWNWLTHLRDTAGASGATFTAYCWNAGAENPCLRKMAGVLDILDEVDEFLASVEWVDLLQVWKDQVITGHGNGLKLVAPLTGFHWTVDDPGGAESMLRYDVAVSDSPDSTSARQWLLDYNRSDCEATFAVRNWLESSREIIPPIESVDPRLLGRKTSRLVRP